LAQIKAIEKSAPDYFIHATLKTKNNCKKGEEGSFEKKFKAINSSSANLSDRPQYPFITKKQSLHRL